MNAPSSVQSMEAGRGAMRLPVQAAPARGRRPRRPQESADGVLPSLIPCYRGRTCEMEDFLGLVNNCNECLGICGHSIGDVGNCTFCPGPLPPGC